MGSVIFDIAIKEIDDKAFGLVCEGLRENLPIVFNSQCRMVEGSGHSAVMRSGVLSVGVKTSMTNGNSLKELFSYIRAETQKHDPQAAIMIGHHDSDILDTFVADRTETIERSFSLFSKLLKI